LIQLGIGNAIGLTLFYSEYLGLPGVSFVIQWCFVIL